MSLVCREWTVPTLRWIRLFHLPFLFTAANGDEILLEGVVLA